MKSKKKPNIVYKYRNWNNLFHKKILTHNEIHFAQPKSFGKGSFDCDLERDYDSITDEEIYNQCCHFAIRDFPNLSRTEQILMANKLFKDNLYYDFENRKLSRAKFDEILNEKLSVFCSSITNDSIELWETFADNHRGFCIGINFDKFLLNELINTGFNDYVNYYDESNKPKVKPVFIHIEKSIDEMLKLIFNLPIKFKHENEYRFTKLNLKERNIHINSDVIEEIIFGEKMNQNDVDEIIEVLKIRFPNIRKYRAILYDQFKLISIVPI